MIRRLTEQEKTHYEEYGYVVLADVFPPDELEGIDREIDRILPEANAGGKREGWIYNVANKSDIAGAFAEDERMLALVEDVVQPGIAIHSSKLVTKLPNSSEICHWHQDEAFYLDTKDPETVSKARMSVWVPLQEASLDNGCLWVVPGSHKWGLQSYNIAPDGTCVKRIDREAYANEHAIAVPIPAGSVVLFTAWTWHHSKNNHTDHVRRAFIVSYQEATLRKGSHDQWKILRPAPGEPVAATA
jgi:ectoine hydroxylase-related dioxygenase (phytanoyl-CoA dioxygenase family)